LQSVAEVEAREKIEFIIEMITNEKVLQGNREVIILTQSRKQCSSDSRTDPRKRRA